MPVITDPPPPNVAADLAALRAHLDASVPARRTDANLLIATWNLRAFASLTREWTAGPSAEPKRDLRGLLAIGEIIRRFDVVALQEVKGNLRALRDLMRLLGEDWAFLMTDITLGAAGNDERMAFVFDTTRLKPSGLACELVVPPEWLKEIDPDALNRQFARTPYAVSFKAGDTTFILVTLHVIYGNAMERVRELKAIARWMRDWANRETAWSHNLIALGDFNIDRQGDLLWQAFTSTGLTAPEALNKVPRTLFSNPARPEADKFYDQIAWFQTARGVKKLSIPFVSAGYVDFLPYVYTGEGFSKQAISFRVSDHYPLWAEFALAA